MKGAELKSMVMEFNSFRQTISRLSKNYNENVLNGLLAIEPVLVEDLINSENARRIASSLEKTLNDAATDIVTYEVQPDVNTSSLTIKRNQFGLSENIVLGESFFRSSEYRSLVAYTVKLKEIENPEQPITVVWGETSVEVSLFAEAVNWIMSRARKGFSIQRYKGLGEMNPEQLWDTTMDPAVRRLLQVTVEDDFGTDETFATLMGDQVEPRREFIEKNAFAVSNLDV
jgi:DNA gyrase subunit B